MPSHQQALAQYRQRAASYDRRVSVRLTRKVQRRAVERLELEPGMTVLDVACGTGLNFPAIERAVGPGGQLIGVELSPAMPVR